MVAYQLAQALRLKISIPQRNFIKIIQCLLQVSKKIPNKLRLFLKLKNVFV